MQKLQQVKKQTNDRGFTIIEVVLVLAIAGLIFLMVFIALPALQTGQRDTARKNDTSIVASTITKYTSNNRGTFPSTANLQAYLKPSDNALSANTATMTSGSTTVYKVAVDTTKPLTVTPTDGTITVYKSMKCGASGPVSQALTTGTPSQFATVTLLEGNGKNTYCQDS